VRFTGKCNHLESGLLSAIFLADLSYSRRGSAGVLGLLERVKSVAAEQNTVEYYGSSWGYDTFCGPWELAERCTPDFFANIWSLNSGRAGSIQGLVGAKVIDAIRR
jgi:hypothetical protein